MKPNLKMLALEEEKLKEALSTCGQCGHMQLTHRPKCGQWIGRGKTHDVFCTCQTFVRLP